MLVKSRQPHSWGGARRRRAEPETTRTLASMQSTTSLEESRGGASIFISSINVEQSQRRVDFVERCGRICAIGRGASERVRLYFTLYSLVFSSSEVRAAADGMMTQPRPQTITMIMELYLSSTESTPAVPTGCSPDGTQRLRNMLSARRLRRLGRAILYLSLSI